MSPLDFHKIFEKWREEAAILRLTPGGWDKNIGRTDL